jgi:hypothetical protein
MPLKGSSCPSTSRREDQPRGVPRRRQALTQRLPKPRAGFPSARSMASFRLGAPAQAPSAT